MVLWGVGNHGGGPSRIDLENLQDLINTEASYEIVHSTPEAYFQDVKQLNQDLPRHDKDLNAWAVGCYTSQVRMKQKHRQLENELYLVEKMLSHAVIAGKISYP